MGLNDATGNPFLGGVWQFRGRGSGKVDIDTFGT